MKKSDVGVERLKTAKTSYECSNIILAFFCLGSVFTSIMIAHYVYEVKGRQLMYAYVS